MSGFSAPKTSSTSSAMSAASAASRRAFSRQAPTFISYEPQFAPPSGDDYRIIKRASGKQYLHYYFYVLDPVMGPMSLRVARTCHSASAVT
jgi:hypothetical protein